MNGGRGGSTAPFLLRLARSGTPKSVIDRRSESVLRDRRDGYSRFRRRIGLVQQLEQAGGRFDKIAAGAQVGIAIDGPETDHELIGPGFISVEPEWL